MLRAQLFHPKENGRTAPKAGRRITRKISHRGKPWRAPKRSPFIDPSVSDLDTLLVALRPDVAAVLLDSSEPAAAQIAKRCKIGR
jgi:hypothetical protein